jgi:ribosomal protein L29
MLLPWILLRDIEPTMVTQIKPLTEEEKKQKLEDLRKKMAEKRAQKSVKDAEEAKANEAIRRKSGKVGSSLFGLMSHTDVRAVGSIISPFRPPNQTIPQRRSTQKEREGRRRQSKSSDQGAD